MVLLAVGILLASVFFLAARALSMPWPFSRGITAAGQPEPKAEKENGRPPKPPEMREPQSPDEDEDSPGSDPTTPKAAAQPGAPLPIVPAFSIDDSHVSPPSAPPAISAPVLGAPALSARSRSPAELMPPPAVKPSALRPLPKLSNTLAPPRSAASSLRAPPGRAGPGLSPQAGSTLTASTLPPAQRASRKVQLEPGHSPLDWAHLKRHPPHEHLLRGADVPPERLIKVLPSELKARNGRRGREAWGTWRAKVYNLTPYLKFHPGGVGELLRGAGKVGEAERLFNEIHPWVSWEAMLEECLVGILVSEEEARAVNRLEEVD